MIDRKTNCTAITALTALGSLFRHHGGDYTISAANTVSTFDRVQVAAQASRAVTGRFAGVVSRMLSPIFVSEITRRAVAA